MSTAPGCSELALCESYRDQFPVTKNLIYCNHAAVTPIPTPVRDAMQWLANDACDWGSLHYDQWLAAYDGFRDEAAALIGASPREIAIVKNTSEGIATVAMGIDWKPGDAVVAFREEFPANYYPWLRLERLGVEIRWLPVDAALEQIEAAARGARLLAISWVNYLSGYRVDLDGIGEICERHGVFFFVDAIQGLGAFPIDVRRSKIHALAADGHKWLLGPEGCGLLYIQQGRQDEVFPVEFGWTNVAGYGDYASRDMTLRSDAGRYECGTLNTISIYGLRAAMKLLREVGVDRIGREVRALARRLAEGAAERGMEVLSPLDDAHGSGVVTVRRPDEDARLTVKRLRDGGVIAAPRQGWARLSPHFYLRAAEMDQVLELLGRV